MKYFFAQYKHTYGRLQSIPRQRYEGLHIMFIHEEAHTNECFISCDGHQLYAFKGRGVDLEVEGVRYIEIHHGPHTC